MTIDASNVSIRTEAFDPATGERVVTVDGVETERIPAPDEAAAYARAAKLEALLDSLADVEPADVVATATKTDAIERALVDKGVITAKDITDAAVAIEEPVDVKPR